MATNMNTMPTGPYQGFPQPNYDRSGARTRNILIAIAAVLAIAVVVIVVVLVTKDNSTSGKKDTGALKECDPECENGGTCDDGACICRKGFSGDQCEKKAQADCSLECQNGGSCMNVEGMSMCSCAEKFSGELCEIECSLKCQNGGTCVVGESSDTCRCKTGFSGRLCQSSANQACDPPCGEAGTCVRGKCQCDEGFSGETCEDTQPPAETCSLNCGTHGHCEVSGNNERCVCDAGYTGRTCQSRIQPSSTASAPQCTLKCGAHGACVLSGGQQSCKCSDGWKGDTCNEEPQTDPCAGVTCQNGGKCAAGKCECVNGYTGDKCEKAPNVNPTQCPSQKISGDSTRKVTVNGTSRSYILHVPSAYKGDSPVPLLVDLHALGGSGSQEKSSSTYPKQVDSEGVISAFPDGKQGPSGNAWNLGPCCVDGVDDVAFVRALVADVQTVACIDKKRIYAAGFSMGGGMSHHLGCMAADIFAAVAPAAFDLLKENMNICKPARPITVYIFRGQNDPIVPYAGGLSSVVPNHPITFLGAVGSMEKWAEFNKCTGQPVAAGTNCQAYTSCADNTTVTLCTKPGGSHEGGDASKSWPELKKHVLP